MPVIDMSTLKPIDEFGSRAWGEAVVECSIKMLEATSLPTSITRALTEDYTHPPARLMADDRKHSGYYLMVKDGKVSGGDGVHHLAFIVNGVKQVIDDLEDFGLPLLHRGNFPAEANAPGGKFAYLQGLDKLGVDIELLEFDG